MFFLGDFKISFITRQINNVVHLLARKSLSYTNFQIHDHITSCIETVIINEMKWVDFAFVDYFFPMGKKMD